MPSQSLSDILDHTKDPARTTWVQALSKVASKQNRRLLEQLETSLGQTKTASQVRYACPESKLFPVTTMEETAVSKLYFEFQREKLAAALSDAQLEKIADTLDTFMNLHDIPKDLCSFAQTEKHAADSTPAPMYLLPDMKVCKVAGKLDLAQAGTLFADQYTNLRVSDRVEFANNFVKAAGVYDYSEAIPDEVLKYAGMLDTDATSLVSMLELRKAAAYRKGIDDNIYEKLATLVEERRNTFTRDDFTKLAETIYAVDKDYGFDAPKYERRLKSAYDAVFNTKVAAGQSGDLKSAPTKEDIVVTYGPDALEAVELEDGTIDIDKLNDLRATHGS